jgi:hypothetical protein
MFDTQRIFEVATNAIGAFALEHSSETFYAFAIDASLLCLNSEEAFSKTLKSYQERYPGKYELSDDILYLKQSTGDWAYQGFFLLDERHGFDDALYQEHYKLAMHSQDGHDPSTPYAIAMTEVIQLLEERNAFASLRRTEDFYVTWVDHDY